MISGLRIGVFNCLAAAAFAAVGLLLPAAVDAQTRQQIDWCNNDLDVYSLDLQINGCTAVIQSRRESQQIRAIAFDKRANAYYGKGDYDRAIADDSEAIRLNPKYAAAYVNRGIAYRAKGDYDRAIADLNEAIRLNPNDAGAYNNRGIAYEHKGDHDHAIADFDEAIRLDPKDALAYYNRGLAKRARGDTAGGDADIAQARQLDPNIGE